MLESELQKLGLSDKETRVYLASLRLGKSPVQEIANQAKVNRGTTYNIIESLMGKGLMTSFEQGKKTYFTAESPERLMSLIRIQEEELRQKEREFSPFLKELMLMYASADSKPKVKFYEGWDSIYLLHDEYLKTKSKRIDNILNIDNIESVLPQVAGNYTPSRVKKGIHSQFLYISRRGPDRELEKTDAEELRESRYLPFSELPFDADITIFDDKVSLESFGKRPMAVLIENSVIADSLKCMFEYIWKNVDLSYKKSLK